MTRCSCSRYARSASWSPIATISTRRCGTLCTHIQRRFGSDVCSVYSVDKLSAELVLSATVGLRPESVGQVRMPLHEGLTGLVAGKLGARQC